MKDKQKEVIEKLEEYDINVYNCIKNDDGVYIIYLENSFLSIDDKDLTISFHINCIPSYSAKIILVLSEIKGIKIFIANEFIFDENKFLDGEEAFEYKRVQEKKEIIDEFIKEQTQTYYLNNMKPFNC